METIRAGIYFGTSITASYWNLDRRAFQVVYDEPNQVTLLRTGEILVGSRAVNYSSMHPDAERYDVSKNMEDWCCEGKRIRCFGKSISSETLLRLIMQQVYDNICLFFGKHAAIECVVASPLLSIIQQTFLQNVMAESGFQVQRVWNTAVACGWDHSNMQSNPSEEVTYLIAEGNRITTMRADSGDGVFEVLSIMSEYREAEHALSTVYENNSGSYYFTDEQNQEILREFHEYADPTLFKTALNASMSSLKYLLRLRGLLDGAMLLNIAPYEFKIQVNHRYPQVIQESERTIPSKAFSEMRINELNPRTLTLIEGSRWTKSMTLSQQEAVLLRTNAEAVRLELCEAGSLSEQEQVLLSVFFGKKNHSPEYELDFLKGLPRENEERSAFLIYKTMKQTILEFTVRFDELTRTEYGNRNLDGMAQIVRKCQNFNEKWNYASRSGEAGVLRQMAMDWITILDDMNYGLVHAGKNFDEAEYLLFKTRIKFNDCLYRAGIRPIAARGAKFDPAWHEAVSVASHPNIPEGMVLNEVRSGYSINGTLLRAPLVEVSG